MVDHMDNTDFIHLIAWLMFGGAMYLIYRIVKAGQAAEASDDGKPAASSDTTENTR